MQRAILCIALAITVGITALGEDRGRFVWADFERAENGRPVSAEGGIVRLFSYQQNQAAPVAYHGMAGAQPPAPELVRLKADESNHAAAFDFEIHGPNVFAGAGIEINGRLTGDANTPADDLSGYSYVELDVYATGVQSLRMELISRGHGIDLPLGYPQAVFKVKEGLNTYRLKLKSFRQPFWAQRVDLKKVLENLTAVTVIASCEQCTSTKGTVVVDNVVFTK